MPPSVEKKTTAGEKGSRRGIHLFGLKVSHRQRRQVEILIKPDAETTQPKKNKKAKSRQHLNAPRKKAELRQSARKKSS